MINSLISPILAQTMKMQPMRPQNNKKQVVNVNMPSKTQYSPLLKEIILAQSKQILATNVASTIQISKPTTIENYKNNLKSMFLNNEAQILGVIIRTMNAQDKDGNELIQGDEKSGNLINAIERLDEIKNTGFNTLHILPIHPTGKTNAMGTAGSLYSPADFLAIDPEIVEENPPEKYKKRIEEIYFELSGKKLTKMDKNDPYVAKAQCKLFLEECHKRNIKAMLDLPSCGSVDFANKHPEMMAVDANGKEKVPQGWQDIRMLKPFKNEETRELNTPVLDLHKKYVDMCVELGFDGIRADVGRAKPVEFWNVIINYSHAKDPQFAWLAETYTHEDASPQLNMPYDRPKELLEVGFDSYYGQYHIFNEWTQAQQLYDYVKENIDLNNEIGKPKSLIGSFATHDDSSPMLYGGAPWVMFTSILQGMLPQLNPYMIDGTQTGDFYIYPYDHAIVKETETNNHECTVHTGRIDIFNKSRKPGGKFPEIENVIKTAFSLRDNKYNEVNKNSDIKLNMQNAKDVITKGSFIILPTNNPEIIAFARHKDGKTLVFIGNRNVNKPIGGKITIPGLKAEQKFKNLMPKYGEECKFQNNKNGTVTAELGTSRACVFEIDDSEIEKLSDPKNVMQQKYLN